MDRRGKESGYLPHVDGLRAVAVLAVLFYHADLGLTGGYVGVDVFFVISGFLISGLILKDVDAGRFGIVSFWERRVRRILPAVALMVAVVIAASWFLLMPRDFQKLGQSVVAQMLLMSNAFFWWEAGYFSPGAETEPLLHTWSLAVEEQFYLIFPFVLALCARRGRSFCIAALSSVAAVSLGASCWGATHFPDANFYFLPTRAWELLLGALLALGPRTLLSGWLAELAGVAGVALIGAAAAMFTDATPFPGAAALLPCVGAALVVAGGGGSVAGRVLSLRPVVFIGLISYSLYLWHWPILVFVRYWANEEVSVLQRLVLLAISGVAATLSWRFVETPVRTRRVLATRASVFRFAGVATALVLAAGLTVHFTRGFPTRVPEQARVYASAIVERQLKGEVSITDALAERFDVIGNKATGSAPRLLVWGDSHAMAMLPMLDSLCADYGVSAVAAVHPGFAPLIEYRSGPSKNPRSNGVAFNQSVFEYVRKNRVPVVVLIARWGRYVTTDGSADALTRGLRATVEGLRGLGARVWIVQQVPEYPKDVPRALSKAALYGRSVSDLGVTVEAFRAEQARVASVFAGIVPDEHVTMIDPAELFLEAGRYQIAKDGLALFSDKDHLTRAGAMLTRPAFEPVMREFVGEH